MLLALWARGGFIIVRVRDDRAKGGRKRRGVNPIFLLALVPLVLMLGYFITDRLVETRREQIQRKLHEMAAGVKARDMDRIFRHISSQFRHEHYDRDSFRRAVDAALRNNLVSEVEVWDLKFLDEGGNVEFQAKPKGGMADGYTFFRVTAEFVRDPDGQWRMKGFQVFKPYADSKEPMSIPQLPR